MNISDINLDFLYLKKGISIGVSDPFWKKWKKEKMKFYDFIEKEPLEKVISLTINVFKEKYPRVYFSFVDLNQENVEYLKDENGYDVLEDRFIFRNDLKSFKTKDGLISEDESSILEGMEYEFKEPISNIEEIIEEQLNGKEYEKNSQEGITTYELVDSPILRLTVSPSKFLMEINRAKWEFRVP
ncbi:hypothetical protein [Tenacibaculum xiamenense]|uniref:hypothetical protein n=1 Tax=Tenacibaculum xiamenense TaxID=1261553 RepID=UPI003895E224